MILVIALISIFYIYPESLIPGCRKIKCASVFNCDCKKDYCKCDFINEDGKTVKIKCPYIQNNDTLPISKIKNENRFLTIEENGVIKNKVEGYNDYVIYDPQESYSEQILEKMDLEQLLDNEGLLSEYLKYYFWAYQKQTKTSFSNEDIAILISLMLNTYSPNTSNYVQQIAKRYFEIENYELPTGTYEVPNYGNYTIIKVDDYYIRSAVEESPNTYLEYTSLVLKKIERNENKITISYDNFEGSSMMGGCYSEKLESENKEECKIGEYILELTYNQEAQSLRVVEFKYINKS